MPLQKKISEMQRKTAREIKTDKGTTRLTENS